VGTVMGSEHEPRLVRALGYEVEIALEPLMLFVVNDDRPGRIGRIGTLLGEADINIANMAVSRNRPKDRALMVLTLDSPITPDLLELIRGEPGLLDPRAIVLERSNG
ncbi:MAG TPA: ACT domain-containing protein, partial [Gaiellaceae bacterium]|nr:ACT domain-containing protein [Gaiellaceae bacterium]